MPERGEIHSPGDGNHAPQQPNERSAACVFPRCVDGEKPPYCGNCEGRETPYAHEYGAPEFGAGGGPGVTAALTCPECGVPLELGHDCLADRAPASPFSALEQLQARQIAELEAVVLSLGGCLEEAADWLDVDLAHAPDVPTAQADRELIARWRAALETARSAAKTWPCPVCGKPIPRPTGRWPK